MTWSEHYCNKSVGDCQGLHTGKIFAIRHVHQGGSGGVALGNLHLPNTCVQATERNKPMHVALCSCMMGVIYPGIPVEAVMTFLEGRGGRQGFSLEPRPHTPGFCLETLERNREVIYFSKVARWNLGV